MFKKVALFGVLLAVMGFCVAESKAQEYKIGVLANRGADVCIKQWKGTADYLTAKVGTPFVIVPLSFDQLPASTKEGTIDFVLTNPAFYAELNRLYKTQAIVTMVNSYKGKSMDQFGGVVIAKKDSPISKLNDFKGKKFMCVKQSSFGGWVMAKQLFLENGIDPDRDFQSLEIGKTHDNVVYAVQNGSVDGGTVRTGTLEKMAEEGKVKIEDFKIIAQIQDEFPLIHSTSLYPEWPLASCVHVPAGLSEQVSQHLLAVSPGDPAAKAAKIMGWGKAMDYQPVVECLRATKTEGFGE